MKKQFICILALATSLVACTDDYNDWAAPQQNEEEAAKEVTFTVAPASVIDFAQVTTDSVVAFVPTVTAEEGATASYQLVLEGKHTLGADAQGRVTASELSDALVAIYGKRPTERTLNGVVNAYVNIHGQAIKKTGNVEVKAIPVAPVIETAYYLVGSCNGWNVQNGDFKFQHSGKDVYDDPVFTLVVPAPVKEDGTRDDLWFKIAPQSAFESGDWATVLGAAQDGDESLKGSLVGKTDKDPGAFKMPATDQALFYKIELNLMDYAYTITPLAFEEFIYVPGNHQNWNPTSAPALQSAASDGIYTGFSYLDGGFKFTKARDWSAEYNWNDFKQYSEGFSADGTNIVMGTPGFYFIEADIPAASLKVTATTWGLIGAATAGGWDTSTPMTYNKEAACWEITTDLKADEYKFRANNGWDINVGGDLNNLTYGGGNLKLTEAGNYTIQLYLTRSTKDVMYATVTKN